MPFFPTLLQKKSASEGPIAFQTPPIGQYKPVFVNRDYQKSFDLLGKMKKLLF